MATSPFFFFLFCFFFDQEKKYLRGLCNISHLILFTATCVFDLVYTYISKLSTCNVIIKLRDDICCFLT